MAGNSRTKAIVDAITHEFDVRREILAERAESMEAVQELREDLEQVAEGMLEVALGDDGLDEEIDALLVEFDEPVQRQVVQMEADAWAVELFRVRLQNAGGQDASKAVEEAEANIQAIEELYGVKPRPISPETKKELRRQAIERQRVDFQRLSTRAKVQLKNGNQVGLKATEEAQERIREAVKGMAAVE